MSFDPAVRARLQQLLAEYGARVRASIARHGLDQYGLDPADVEQEVRIRLWKALERDRNAAFHASYIHRTVLSAVIDAIRVAQARPVEALPEGETSEALVETAPGPERQALGTQEFSRVAACMASLPLRRREAVALHLQGFSLREIGSAVGVSEEAARKLLDRGMLALKTRLAAQGFGDFDE
ncbi:MAG: sigma-70 family RNA polymerase sigma factor [Proteobacteria bacterium]|nr:sigma-70 family RNA polymerase sigma factor [Pseudomonadota bacterium]